MKLALRLFSIVAVAVACAEVQEDPSPRPRSTEVGSKPASSEPKKGTTKPGDPATPSSPSDPAPTDPQNPADPQDPANAPSPAARLIINEVRANGPDWVEVYNAGDADADLEGMRVADIASDGSPKGSDAVVFAAGESLAPGDYLVVLAGWTGPTGGTVSSVCEGVVPSCYHAVFKLSDKTGDHVFLQTADHDTISEADYPANAAAAGESLALQSDGSWQPVTPTPGAPN